MVQNAARTVPSAEEVKTQGPIVAMDHTGPLWPVSTPMHARSSTFQMRAWNSKQAEEECCCGRMMSEHKFSQTDVLRGAHFAAIQHSPCHRTTRTPLGSPASAE